MKLVTEHDLNTRVNTLKKYIRMVENTTVKSLQDLKDELADEELRINAINTELRDPELQNVSPRFNRSAEGVKLRQLTKARDELRTNINNLKTQISTHPDTLSARRQEIDNSLDQIKNNKSPFRSIPGEAARLRREKYEIDQKLNGFSAAPSAPEATPAPSAPEATPAPSAPEATPAPSAPEATPAPSAPSARSKPDPKIVSLQQELNRLGANLRVDGIMGPKTRAAQQKYQNQPTPPAKSVPKNAQPAPTVNGNYPSQPQTQSSYAAPPAGNYPSNPRTSRFPPSSKYTTRPAQNSSDVDRALGAFAATESVSYNEDQTLARIIGLAGL